MARITRAVGSKLMLRVKDLMTTDVVSLLETDTLDVSRFLMESKRIRHVPVVNSRGDLTGLLTHRDLLATSVSNLAEIDPEQQREILQTIPISEVMITPVKTADPDMELEKAAELMLRRKFGCLPVVADKRLVGILTESDFVRLTLNLLEYAKEMTSSVKG